MKNSPKKKICKVNQANIMSLPSMLFKVLLSTFILLGCVNHPAKKNLFIVKNNLNLNRTFETVVIDLGLLENSNSSSKGAKGYSIINSLSKEELRSQSIDSDGDGILDQLLFQPEIKPNSEATFEVLANDNSSLKDTLAWCFSRFVPERTDDYAWENNRVAFRTYGPTAQKMVEEHIEGGTLSSGIDAWLKRVDYPIINKWYAKTISGQGSYHKDTGEGLDNFHVGASRGVGGIAVQADSLYYYSKNFTHWKTITNGPIRTSFILTYTDWDANGKIISEIKHISLDYGSNLSKFTIELKGTPTVSAGLTLHQKEGEISSNISEGWMSYWEPFEDSELGQGMVVPQEIVLKFQNYDTAKKDESNLYAKLKVINNQVTYYAGFGWKKSGQFKTKEDWNAYLSEFSKKINSPLEINKL